MSGELRTGDIRARPQLAGADIPPLTLGLVRDQRGFVYRSASFAVTATELSIRRILDGLGTPPGALVAIERDALCATSIAWLQANGYRFLPSGEIGAVRSVFEALITNPPKAGQPMWVFARKNMFYKEEVTQGLNKVGGIMIKAVFDSLGTLNHSRSSDQYGEACDAADLFISVLAYQCVHLVRRRLADPAPGHRGPVPDRRQCTAQR